MRSSGRLGRQLEEVMKVGRAARREVFKRYAWDHELDESAGRLLGPLVDMARDMNGDGQVAVFTTNYDRAVEEVCEGRGLRMHDGFRLDVKTGRRMWAAEFGAGKGEAGPAGKAGGSVRLYKLHGSLDWKRNDKHGVLRVDYDGPSGSAHYWDVLIHPSLADNKGAIRGEPYRAIHESFKKELESSDACVVVGFSFRDRHIAGEFRRFAEHDGKALIVVGPDAHEDVYRRIFGQEPAGEDRQDGAGIPVVWNVDIGGGKTRSAAVIKERLNISTARKIAMRAQSVIEDKHDIRPVHTPGSCADCDEKYTIDDMKKHVAAHYGGRDGKKGTLFRILRRVFGAPWMLALARPDATLGDLREFLQKEWARQYHPSEGHMKMKFATGPHSSPPDAGMLLIDVPWDKVQIRCNGGEGNLEVAAVRHMNIRDLREPIKALAVGEAPPVEIARSGGAPQGTNGQESVSGGAREPKKP